MHGVWKHLSTQIYKIVFLYDEKKLRLIICTIVSSTNKVALSFTRATKGSIGEILVEKFISNS